MSRLRSTIIMCGSSIEAGPGVGVCRLAGGAPHRRYRLANSQRTAVT